MKVSINLKKQVSLDDELSRSNLCFRVRERSVDIKVVSELVVYDKYWDMETLQYKRTTIIPVVEQKRIAEQIASIIEVIERTYSDKADSSWLKQSIEDVLHPATAYERTHPSLLKRIQEYAEKFEGTDGARQAILRFERQMKRYHDYHREILGEEDFTLFVETLTIEQMSDFREYIAPVRDKK